MLSFKVILPDQSEGQYQITKTSSVKQFVQFIKEQNNDKDWNKYELELYLFDQCLNEDGQVDKIICSPENDYLTLKVKKGERIKRLQTFFVSALQKIQKKTEADMTGLKKALKKSSTIQELPKQTEKKNVKKLLSFFVNASHKIAEMSRQKTLNFTEKVQQNEKAKHMTYSQDPSRINQEEDPLKNNNDTVLGLLDHLEKPNNQNFYLKNNDTQIKPKSLSPEARKYLERKKKAIENLNDPIQQAKAKQLVAELKRQRKELEERKTKQQHNESDQLEESIEKYKMEREQYKEHLNQEKRIKIKERLQEMQKHQEIQLQKNQEQKNLILELKNKEREKKKQIEEREELLKKQYYEDAKLKLQQRKKLAIPIRLEEINKHEEDYLNKKQLLKLEKDQKKIEREIVIQQETKQIYKAKQILQKVMDVDQKFKNKEIVEKQQKAEKILRKQKYAEIVKEYHKPNIKIQTDIQFSRAVHNKSDNSLQEEYIDFLKEGEGKSSQTKVDSIRNKLYRQAQQGSEKNVHKIQNVLNLQKVSKTKVTESLQKGFVPSPSLYYQPKGMKSEVQVEEQQKKKPINYLKELEEERKNQQQGKVGQLKSHSVPRLQQDYRSIMERGKRYEKEAQRKEHEAFYLNDDKLKEEAEDLFLKSVQEKIRFLEKI
ncbi:unnamed protein product [Paramecium sonneborni]|uniref:Uncharacterized protein n=1 Tax=Paramecium sonneborni TaxID=65129 RepID=A0A8S1L5U2_9CILI|nr:unnamed protein product [Paramecium sonneborni]